MLRIGVPTGTGQRDADLCIWRRRFGGCDDTSETCFVFTRFDCHSLLTQAGRYVVLEHKLYLLQGVENEKRFRVYLYNFGNFSMSIKYTAFI